MWRHTLLISYLISISAFLVEHSHCVPTSTNKTAHAVYSRQAYGCFPHSPASPTVLDRTAPVLDCARALLQFPKNAPPGKSRFPNPSSSAIKKTNRGLTSPPQRASPLPTTPRPQPPPVLPPPNAIRALPRRQQLRGTDRDHGAPVPARRDELVVRDHRDGFVAHTGVQQPWERVGGGLGAYGR